MLTLKLDLLQTLSLAAVLYFIGLQLRPILDSLAAGQRWQYFLVAAAIVVTVIAVRIAWQLGVGALVRLRYRAVRPARRPPARARMHPSAPRASMVIPKSH